MPEESLGSFFSEMSKENQDRVQNSINRTQGGARKVVLPGKYVMEVSAFAWKDKKSGEIKKVPDFNITRRKALQLKIVLAVADEGTEAVPKGSSLFHNINISPAQDSDDSKIDTIMRFTKPILMALTGSKNISFTQEWLHEFCTADFEEDENGNFKITRDHKMKGKVFVTVDDEQTPNGQIVPRAKYINPLRPGDKSETDSAIKSAGLPFEESSDGAQTSEAETFNFGLNDASKDPGATSTPSTISGITDAAAQTKEEDY